MADVRVVRRTGRTAPRDVLAGERTHRAALDPRRLGHVEPGRPGRLIGRIFSGFHLARDRPIGAPEYFLLIYFSERSRAVARRCTRTSSADENARIRTIFRVF